LSALVALLHRLARRTVLPRRWRNVVEQSEAQAGLLCRAQPRMVWAALGISGLCWIAIAGEFWLMAALLGFRLPALDAVTALVAARIAILLPLPAGLGALEASQALAMHSLGLAPAAGIAISLLIRARDVLLGLAGLWLGGARFWQSQPTSLDAGAPVRPYDTLDAEPSGSVALELPRLAERTTPAPPV
jgi:hypothetical protein